MYSSPAGVNVGSPPNASTAVSGSAATARRCTAGSPTNTKVPAGASSVSPSSVKVARPRATY